MKGSTHALSMLAAFAIMALPAHDARAQTATAKIVANANAFLATLDSAQRQRVMFAFDNDAQRVRWSNLPVTIVKRTGISMGEMTPAQREAAMKLLQATLSPRGFQKVGEIVQADQVLKTSQNNSPMFGNDLYYISFLGTPSTTKPWMLQFGGHHLGLNVTIIGEKGIMTPSLTAAQPAMYTVNGKTIRPLGAENDLAFALLNALDQQQKAQAVLTYRVPDLVLGPGKDGRPILPEGLIASAMNPSQQALLLDLIAQWSGIVHESAADARMAEIKAGLAKTYFAWSGPMTVEPGKNGTAYFRVTGPNLVIEYAPQVMGGDASMHIHSIYRDPTDDYGKKYLIR